MEDAKLDPVPRRLLPALQTGRYSVRSGLSLVIIPGTPAMLHAEKVTLSKFFKSVGYSTAYIGKWHLGPGQQSLPTPYNQLLASL